MTTIAPPAPTPTGAPLHTPRAGCLPGDLCRLPPCKSCPLNGGPGTTPTSERRDMDYRAATPEERTLDALRRLLAETGRAVTVETLGYAVEPMGRAELAAALGRLAAEGRIVVDGEAVTLP